MRGNTLTLRPLLHLEFGKGNSRKYKVAGGFGFGFGNISIKNILRANLSGTTPGLGVHSG
jgi:hypothetical protein